MTGSRAGPAPCLDRRTPQRALARTGFAMQCECVSRGQKVMLRSGTEVDRSHARCFGVVGSSNVTLTPGVPAAPGSCPRLQCQRSADESRGKALITIVWVLLATSLPRDRQGTAAGTSLYHDADPRTQHLHRNNALHCCPEHHACHSAAKGVYMQLSSAMAACRLRHWSRGSPVRPSRQARLTTLSRAHAARLWPSAASAALATAPQTSGGSSDAGSRSGVAAQWSKAKAATLGPSSYWRLLVDDLHAMHRQASPQPSSNQIAMTGVACTGAQLQGASNEGGGWGIPGGQKG